MGRLERFERRLESMVSGGFARVFRSEVEPVEIASALQREMDQNARRVSRDRSLVPNVFAVELSPSDHDRLSSYQDALMHELDLLVREHAQIQRYSFPGQVRIQLDAEPELSTGQFRIRSSVAASSMSEAPRPDLGTAPGYLVINDVVHDIHPPGMIIGRGSTADLRISDPGVSRRHAEIRVLGEGQQADLEFHDLDSSNGSTVDGQRVRHALLRDGSTITLGSTTMRLSRSDPRGEAGSV
jgi:hypothetical protein